MDYERREVGKLITEMFWLLAENPTEEHKQISKVLFILARRLTISLSDCEGAGLKLGVAQKKEGVFWPGSKEFERETY